MSKDDKKGRGQSDFFDEVEDDLLDDSIDNLSDKTPQRSIGRVYDEEYVYVAGEDFDEDPEPITETGLGGEPVFRYYVEPEPESEHEEGTTTVSNQEEELDEGDQEEELEDVPSRKGKSKDPKVKRTLTAVGLGVLGVIIGVLLLFNALNNRTEVTNFGLAETEAKVQELFSESGDIRRELTRDALDEATLYVAQLEEGIGKNQLQMKLSQAEKQLESQIQAQRLVSEVTKDGKPYVDISRSSLPVRVSDFPMSYDKEYAEQLKTAYNTTYDTIEKAQKLEDDFNKALNSGSLTSETIKPYKERIEQLPESQLKQRVSREYNTLMDKFQQEHQESVQRAEEAKREAEIIAEQERREAEALAKLEKERIEREAEVTRQNEIARKQEEARIQAEIDERLEQERLEQERIEQERRELEQALQEQANSQSNQESQSSISQPVDNLDTAESE